MATRYSIFPSISDDEVYFAEDFLARPSRDFLAGEGDGVSRETNNSLAVTETSPASLAVDVDTGVARANGYRFEVHTAAEEVSLAAADANNDRIDRIIIRVRTGSSNRDAILTKLTGTPAGSPSAPSLTRSGDTYEISLAQVLVGASVSSVSNSEITDERSDESLCGYLRAQDTNLLEGLASGNSSGEIPINNGTVNTNLNADTVDGSHASAFATSGHTHALGDLSNVSASGEGSGGGFDADTVDGQHASAFLEAGESLLATTVYGSSSTHNYHADAQSVRVICTAGGGGGVASDDSNQWSGGGGGAGGTAIERITGFSGSDSVTVGSGGAAGTVGAPGGSDGGSSSFGAFCSATGGVGGRRGSDAGGYGGVASGGDINITGGDGGASFQTSGAAGAHGGTSYWGGGGRGGFFSSSGHNAHAYGSGGGGGGEGGGTGDNMGGAGAHGVVVVEEYG